MLKCLKGIKEKMIIFFIFQVGLGLSCLEGIGPRRAQIKPNKTHGLCSKLSNYINSLFTM
jgi:hypothetical protein